MKKKEIVKEWHNRGEMVKQYEDGESAWTNAATGIERGNRRRKRAKVGYLEVQLVEKREFLEHYLHELKVEKFFFS